MPPKSRRSGLRSPGALEQWRADWQSRVLRHYLTHYSSRFWRPGQEYKAWLASAQ